MAVKLVSNTKIYLDARKLLDIILDIVPNFPRAYKFTIGAKLQEIGVNLMQEIARDEQQAQLFTKWTTKAV